MSDSFDVVIVGAGTAGCVLAERLSRSGRLRVLVLEAGEKPTGLFVRMPLGFPRLFKTTQDWAFQTEPQASVHGRVVYTPRGKMLGGSGNMNAMMHQWCHPADYDEWAESGATNWRWNDVLDTFRTMESWLGKPLAGRGTEGPMRISPNAHARPLTQDWIAAARAAGVGDRTDYNGHAYAGAWLAELATSDGRRFSTQQAYLDPAMRRANVVVRTGAHVLALESIARVVTGVRYRRNGVDETVRARGVVLSAGAYASPQIMKLSGFGPPAELAQHGIDVRHAMPEVGVGLQDHPVLPMNFASKNPDTLKRAESPFALLRYLFTRKGPLASNGVEGMLFTNGRSPPGSPIDLEVMFMPLEFRKEFLEAPTIHGFSMGAAVVKPKSRGTVRLRSGNPLDAPRIDPALLSDPEGHDAAVLWAGVALARRIAATEPLRQWNGGEITPGPDITSPEALLRHAGDTLQTVYHPTGTCRMGSDGRAVVDPELRVNGLDGLWIADASVMPSVPRGHPNAVVAMIAQRASGWIESALAR